jgi:prevent-host-death family protein
MIKRAKDSISIRELHEKTGELVRRAGASHKPLPVTDRGEVVAVLVAPAAVPLRKRPKRVILPEYRKLILETPQKGDVLKDLDAVRGDR